MPPDRPRRFRFSLITLLIAVNVAGVLVWANVRELSIGIDTRIRGRSVPIGMWLGTEHLERGWPLTYQQISVDRYAPVATGFAMPDTRFRWWPLLANLAACAGILGGLSALTEFLVRRIRKAKRHDG